MKNVYLILLTLSIVFSACKDEGTNVDIDKNCVDCVEISKLSNAQGQAYLTTKYNEILKIASEVTCTDASKWIIIPIGAKACGGPTGFITYEKSINEAVFLKKVENYTKAQIIFNKKWGVYSTCDIPVKPSKVECVDGKAKMIN